MSSLDILMGVSMWRRCQKCSCAKACTFQNPGTMESSPNGALNSINAITASCITIESRHAYEAAGRRSQLKEYVRRWQLSAQKRTFTVTEE